MNRHFSIGDANVNMQSEDEITSCGFLQFIDEYTVTLLKSAGDFLS